MESKMFFFFEAHVVWWRGKTTVACSVVFFESFRTFIVQMFREMYSPRKLTWRSLENHHLDVGDIHLLPMVVFFGTPVTVRFCGGVSPWPKIFILKASFDQRDTGEVTFTMNSHKFQVPRKEVYCTFIMPILEVGLPLPKDGMIWIYPQPRGGSPSS